MERVDVNGDGVIQLTEFVAGLVDWKALQNDSQWGYWVQMAFERLDKNGDGWLGLEEIMEQLPQEDGSTDAGGWVGGWVGGFGSGSRALCSECWPGRGCSLGAGQPVEMLVFACSAPDRPAPAFPSPCTCCPAPAAPAERMLEARRMLREADADGDGRIRWVGVRLSADKCARVCRALVERVCGRILLACRSLCTPTHCSSVLPRVPPCGIARAAARMSLWSC
jgi:hypothetical protein